MRWTELAARAEIPVSWQGERAAVCDVLGVSDFAGATASSLVFAEDGASASTALASAAGVVLLSSSMALRHDDGRVALVRAPKLAFARAARLLAFEATPPGVHASAIIHPTARVPAGCAIGAGTVIEADVTLGEGCRIASNVTLCRGASLGRRVVVQSGTVIGSRGFGYVRDAATGEYIPFPQQGRIVLEDDVEVGANCTIDRGALGETRIGRGSKIDNLVHIGHNCSVGRDVVIAAQAGISGSCSIGDGAILAGQVGISDHCVIGPGVILGGQAGVYVGKTVQGPGQVFAGTPAEPLREHLKSTARLRRLK